MTGTMGTFCYQIEVGTSRGGPFIPVDAVVDTGATYSQIPRPVLQRLGIDPITRRDFTTADGTTTSREIAELYVRLDGQVRSTICVIGEAGMPALLGAYTLEGFGLTADPVNRRLVETELSLLAMAPIS
jgi:clan AA aspartic protease